ncbi:YciI family protein [Paenibacillus hamazuiensis]|uniref:YciI family protein n=1 Tax=Paenibacillus hamazuiensis TaxID=2936508 RepID=UPI00200F8EF4|nr:YciI family protein [Paenibacillus hamazuiensis]
MYVILLTYVKPLEEVDRLLPEHAAYLQKGYDEGKLICSGRKEPRTGGVIWARFESDDEVRQFIENDPFFRHGAATYEPIRFIPTKYIPSLGDLKS